MDLEKLEELLGSEGAAVIGDERRLFRVIQLAGLLDNELSLERGCLGVDAEAEDGAAVAVDDGDEVVVAVAGLDRGEVGVPVVVRGGRLIEALAAR